MPTLANPRLERFAQALLMTLGQYPAKAGKAVGYTPATARSMAARPEVKARVQELKELSAVVVIADEQERRRILTTIARHPIETPVSAGHQIAAVSEMNKMEHIYEEKPQYQDNRQYNFIIQSEEAKKKLELLLSGEKPQQVVVEGEK